MVLALAVFVPSAMASNGVGDGAKSGGGEEDMFEYLYEGIGAKERDEAKEKSKRARAERRRRSVI